ncbi:helix-turn-helix domain-containing protein, partial [Streptomyces sp. A012304]|uniref:helix-turn-helix domain-containing protein n=1 Tax=Streptomyces sp. A012304 TaxID=375446 RepID=UPI00223156D3
MSTDAMKWAIELAPPMPAQLVATLTGLANHADSNGRGAYPSLAKLAAYTCKSERSVRRDLRQLEELKLIRPGDPAKVAHLPVDKRPEVYDLAMERSVPGGRAGGDEETRASARTLASSRERGRAAREAKRARSTSGSPSERADVDDRGDVDVRPDADVTSGGT